MNILDHKAIDEFLLECSKQGVPVNGSSELYGGFATVLTELLRRTNPMVSLHPAVQRLSEKEDPTLEERAIVGLMRTHLEIALEHQVNLKRWLQEVNPLSLKGQDLSDWALEVSSWILPSHLRRIHAVTQGIVTESNQAEHQGGNACWQTTEAGCGNSTAEGRQEPTTEG